MLAGLEELVLQCREETSKTHIQEAIRCYEAGAYRASIISTYIAVCFDLIAKLKVLASAGDGAATQLLQDLNGLQEQLDNGNLQAVAGLLLFERGLLEQFRDKFEFFGAHEYDDLARLRDDRNRCAHPTFLRSEAPYTPSAELARLHLRNALTLVLSQEPRQGKAALAELHLAVLSKYFPEDVPGAVTRLNTTALENAREALVRGFVDALVFGLATKENPYYRKIAAIVALEATIEMNRQIALPRAINGVHKLLRANNDISIEIASILAMRIPEIAESLDPPARATVSRWLSKAEYTYIASAVRRALAIAWLRPAAVARAAALTAEEVANGKTEGAPEIIDRAADLYTGARSWAQANDLAAKCAIPFADRFSRDHLEKIFDSARNGAADLLGSGGFNQFVEALYSESPLGAAALNELTDKYELQGYRPEPEAA